MITLFSQEEIMDAYERELREEERREGRREGLIDAVASMLKKRFPYETISYALDMTSDALEMSIEDVARIAKSAGLAY